MPSKRRLTLASPTLRHQFADPELLQLALTHRSASNRHNERLEFLGDAIIGATVAEFLYQRFPRADEGQLTRMRASLVKRESLAAIARKLELGKFLALGEGEMKSGGWRRDSILANALEAIVGSIFLDGGPAPARAELADWFEPVLSLLDPEEMPKDSKTRLQEYLQHRQAPLPTYQTVLVEGPPHAQFFTVDCELSAPPLKVTAQGHSRRHAEQEAARLALMALQPESQP